MLTLIRGLPGSGKSTYAKNNRNGAHVIEADQFFLVSGVHKWDDSLWTEANSWCYTKTIVALRHNLDVIVANNFTTVAEMQLYSSLCEDWSIVEMYTRFQGKRTLPTEIISAIADKWESVPSGWNVSVKRIE